MTNPAFNSNTWARVYNIDRMDFFTVQGAVNKTAFLSILCLLVGGLTFKFSLYFRNTPIFFIGILAASLVALVMVFITSFTPQISVVTGPLYAILEGFVLGGISALFEDEFAWIILQALGITFAIIFITILLYKMKLFEITHRFILGVAVATGAVALVYIVSFGLSFFGMDIPYIHSTGPVGIGFSVIVIIIATLNLLVDFYNIEQGALLNAPKYMEWYAALGVLITVVWLYLEVLKLLAKVRSRR
ncbi:MAG: Bax inhibitor-1/YccA family protein [Thermoplasmata archaeon]